MAKVAIIIPAYNVGQYVHRAIESAVAQTERDIEIIIVDDGSTDTTASVVSRYTQEDSRILFVSQTNSGVSSARNHGIRLATAEYLLFLDADDWLEEVAVERLLAYTSAECNRLVCCERYYVRQTEDGFTRKNESDCSGNIVLDRTEALHYMGIESRFKFSSACYRLYNVRMIRENHLTFDESIHYGEDSLFVFRYLCMSDGVSYFSEPLWNILDRPGSATKTAYNQKLLTGIHAVDLMLEEKSIDRETRRNLLHLKSVRAMFVQMVALRTEGVPVKDIKYVRGILRQNVFYRIGRTRRVRLILEVIALTTLPLWMLRILLKK